jgi:hypothetical protein
VADLPEGFTIGSSLDPQLAWISSDPVGGYVSPGEIAFATIVQCLDIGCASEWPGGPATRGFIGIEFELGDDLHYGYLDVMMSADAPGGLLLGWAYDSRPGVPIFAGAVPEPSTWTLLGLGIVMLAWRKKETFRWIMSVQFRRVAARTPSQHRRLPRHRASEVLVKSRLVWCGNQRSTYQRRGGSDV